jgi:hypothetical protein
LLISSSDTRLKDSTQGITVALAVAIAVGCGGDSTQPPVPPPPPPPAAIKSSIQFVSGRGQSDTIGAPFKTSVVVKITDSTGAPRARAPISLDILASTDPRVPPGKRSDGLLTSFVLSDTGGVATVPIHFGCVPGTWTLRARSVFNTDADTLSFVVSPGQPARVVATPKDTGMTVGNTTRLAVTTSDRCNNPLSAGVTFAIDSGAPVAAISDDGRLGASALGRARIRVQLASGAAADTTRVSVVPIGMLGVAVGGYATDVGIGIVNLDGSGFRLLTPESNDYSFPSWSPDGTAIAFNAGPIPVGILYRIDLNGVRTKLSMLGAMQSETWPRYSSDGRYLFFTGGYYPDSLDTYRMAADGSGPRVRVTPRRPGSTRYWKASPSPDGTLLAYSDAGFSLHVVNLVTGADRLLQTGSTAESPRFSPDGEWLAFADQYGGVMKLIRPDGTGLRTLVASPVDYWGHDWSPDGAWIVYRQSPPGLWIVRVSDGLRIPLPGSRDFLFPTWRPK